MTTLSDRLLRVALGGIIPADDPHVIADAQAEIERLQARRKCFECGAGLVPVCPACNPELKLKD